MTYSKQHMRGGTLQRWLTGLVDDGMARKGMTQAELTEHLGASHGHVSAVLNGHMMGTLNFWDEALTACGVILPSAPRYPQPANGGAVVSRYNEEPPR